MKGVFIFCAVILFASCKKESAVSQTPTLQFTIAGTTYQFSDNITAKEDIQNGSHYMLIQAKQSPTTYQINIFGTSAQFGPGTYLYSTAMFQQQRYDYFITERDFSLQILSYQNGYLNATFSSSRVGNGIIKDLKITQ